MQDSTALTNIWVLIQVLICNLALQMRSWRTQHAVFDAKLHSQEAEAWTCCMDNIKKSV